MRQITQESIQVRVINDCRGFHAASIDFRGTIEILLRDISPKYLAGLDRVVLRDSGGLTRSERKKRERHPAKVLVGTYCRATSTSTPYIDLFIDVIASRWPQAVLRIPLIRQIVLAKALFHELGHHIHSKIVPEFKGREVTAEAWRARLTREFFERRYWYLMFLLKPLGRVVGKARRRSRARG